MLLWFFGKWVVSMVWVLGLFLLIPFLEVILEAEILWLLGLVGEWVVPLNRIICVSLLSCCHCQFPHPCHYFILMSQTWFQRLCNKYHKICTKQCNCMPWLILYTRSNTTHLTESLNKIVRYHLIQCVFPVYIYFRTFLSNKNKY